MQEPHNRCRHVNRHACCCVGTPNAADCFHSTEPGARVCRVFCVCPHRGLDRPNDKHDQSPANCLNPGDGTDGWQGLVAGEELEDESLAASDVGEEGGKHQRLDSHELDEDVQGGPCGRRRANRQWQQQSATTTVRSHTHTDLVLFVTVCSLARARHGAPCQLLPGFYAFRTVLKTAHLGTTEHPLPCGSTHNKQNPGSHPPPHTQTHTHRRYPSGGHPRCHQ